MGASAGIQDDLVHVAPVLNVSQLISLWEGKLFRELNFVGVLIEHEESLWNNSGGVENSSESGSKKVTLLAIELGVGVDISVQVTSEDVLDVAGLVDVLRLAVWELNPIVQKVVGDPEDSFVDSLAASLDVSILLVLFGLGKSSNGNPVVAAGSKDLTSETNGLCTAHNCKSLYTQDY